MILFFIIPYWRHYFYTPLAQRVSDKLMILSCYAILFWLRAIIISIFYCNVKWLECVQRFCWLIIRIHYGFPYFNTSFLFYAHDNKISFPLMCNNNHLILLLEFYNIKILTPSTVIKIIMIEEECKWK